MTTMVKAEVNEHTNEYIESMQEDLGIPKDEAVATILNVAAAADEIAEELPHE